MAGCASVAACASVLVSSSDRQMALLLRCVHSRALMQAERSRLKYGQVTCMCVCLSVCVGVCVRVSLSLSLPLSLSLSLSVLQAEGSRLKYGQVTCRAKSLSNINIVAPADATPLTVLLTFEASPRKRASALSKLL